MTLDSTPKIKLVNITPKEAPAESPPSATPSESKTPTSNQSKAPNSSSVATSSTSVQAKDNTTAKTKLPQTGANVVQILTIIGMAIILCVVTRSKLNKFKGI
jgi:LPXTG-motif cell wall-anchored protein